MVAHDRLVVRGRLVSHSRASGGRACRHASGCVLPCRRRTRTRRRILELAGISENSQSPCSQYIYIYINPGREWTYCLGGKTSRERAILLGTERDSRLQLLLPIPRLKAIRQGLVFQRAVLHGCSLHRILAFLFLANHSFCAFGFDVLFLWRGVRLPQVGIPAVGEQRRIRHGL